ncbi:transposase [Paenibacillus sp. NPDC058071]|uniref:transposase n=1 Tax=Paenibacillus sp. NPDC058071 TaxID=3346326 RepID=UPI0036DA0682
MGLAEAIAEFDERFFSEESCVQFLSKMKWPDGFYCPRCHHQNYYLIDTRNAPLYECRSCRHQTTLTAGTIMDKSRTSARKWLLTIYFLTRSDCIINARWLSGFFDITYKTAWSMLHKIRHAISEHDLKQLFMGDAKAAVVKYGRPYPLQKEEQLVMAAISSTDSCPAYFKFKVIPDSLLSGRRLTFFGERQLKQTYMPDYRAHSFIIHQLFRIGDTKHVRQIFWKAAHWLNLAFGGIGKKYLNVYLDEYAYRMNYANEPTILERLSSICMNTFKVLLFSKKSSTGVFAAA